MHINVSLSLAATCDRAHPLRSEHKWHTIGWPNFALSVKTKTRSGYNPDYASLVPTKHINRQALLLSRSSGYPQLIPSHVDARIAHRAKDKPFRLIKEGKHIVQKSLEVCVISRRVGVSVLHSSVKYAQKLQVLHLSQHRGWYKSASLHQVFLLTFHSDMASKIPIFITGATGVFHERGSYLAA